MPASKDERNRILQLVESGQVTATQAADLLDALGNEPIRVVESPRERIIRVRATGAGSATQRPQVIATVPVSLLRATLRLGIKLFPQLSNHAWDDVLRAIERGAAGRMLDIQDMEKGERLEIFVE